MICTYFGFAFPKKKLLAAAAIHVFRTKHNS